jgi:hypothetical protein
MLMRKRLNKNAIAAVASIAMLNGCNSRANTTAAAQLKPLDPVDVVGRRAREPMIARGTDRTLFVTGYGEDTPSLWRSNDEGLTWRSVDVGAAVEGAVGNSDTDLAVAPDGTVYLAQMSFDRDKGEGLQMSVGASRDSGATWKWSMLSKRRFDDRPWIDVGRDGAAHMIWNDGSGVSHAISTDRGASWAQGPRIFPGGGSSHLAISPTGPIAVRIVPLEASGNRARPGVDFLEVSEDGGRTWTPRNAPGHRVWSDLERMPRWVEPVAWDSTGALFSLWSEGKSMWLARSLDNGASWRAWRVGQSTETLYYPYLIARAKGELAATWHSGFGDSIRVNVVHITIDQRDNKSIHIASASPFAIRAFERDSLPTTRRDTGGEYVPVIFLSADTLAVVTTIQNPWTKLYGFTFRRFSLREGEND